MSVAKIKKQDLKQAAVKVDEVRNMIAERQKKLNELKKTYGDVIRLQNLQHRINVNNERIEKQNNEIKELRKQLTAKPAPTPVPQPTPQPSQTQQQQQQQRTPQPTPVPQPTPQPSQTQQQRTPQPQQQTGGTFGMQHPQPPQPTYQTPSFSEEMTMIHQLLTKNLSFVKFIPAQEGTVTGLHQFQQSIGQFMMMWKTQEGFYCGTLQPFGMFICIQGQNVYAMNTRSRQPLSCTVSQINRQPCLCFDGILYVGDNLLYYPANIDQVYSTTVCQSVSPLLTKQPLQQQNVLGISKWFVFTLSQ